MNKREETPDLLGEILGETSHPPTPSNPAPGSQKSPKKQKIADRLAGRAAYDLTPELKQRIKQTATRLQIPASQLARFLLIDGMERLENRLIDPSPHLVESDSPRYRYNIDFSEIE